MKLLLLACILLSGGHLLAASVAPITDHFDHYIATDVRCLNGNDLSVPYDSIRTKIEKADICLPEDVRSGYLLREEYAEKDGIVYSLYTDFYGRVKLGNELGSYNHHLLKLQNQYRGSVGHTVKLEMDLFHRPVATNLSSLTCLVKSKVDE